MAVAEGEVPVAMRKVYRRLERWRRQRSGRARIPEALWATAGELAREHGVNPVSRVLRLEFNHLKRIAETDRPTVRKRRATARICGTDRTTNSRRADAHHRVGR